MENKKTAEVMEEELCTEEKCEGCDAGCGKADDDKACGTADEDKKCENEKTEENGSDACKEKKAEPEDEDLNTKYLRLMADFQNYKRRTEKEKSDIYAYANEKIIGELLDVIDNFDRALAQTDNASDSFVCGMNMIFKQFTDVLKKSGLEEIEALGLDFDPNFHNAVMTEDTDEYESGKVSEVLQKGYMLNKKVVRPSMVKVAN